MSNYVIYSVSISDNQKKLAILSKSPITLRLSFNELNGRDTLLLTKTQIKRNQKAKPLKKGVDLKISKTQIQHFMKSGGDLFRGIVKIGSSLLPMAAQAASKVAPGLVTGITSVLGQLGMK